MKKLILTLFFVPLLAFAGNELIVNTDTYAIPLRAVRGTPTDGSGTITTGGTSQTVFAAKPLRVYFEFQNISDTDMYINFGAAAVADSNSFKIAAGGSYINPVGYCPSSSITVICATTGKAYVAKEF